MGWCLGVLWAVAPVASAGETAAGGPDAVRAYRYLQSICRLGPRPSGSRGMQAQQRLLASHFSRFGARVTRQSFDRPDPRTGKAVRMTNMVVSWHPKRLRRILLCCHYDTRPFPDLDRVNPRGRFIGANDGGSGVAEDTLTVPVAKINRQAICIRRPMGAPITPIDSGVPLHF